MNNPDQPNTKSPYPPPPADQVIRRFNPSRDRTMDHRTVSADARYRASVGDVVHKRGNIEANGRLIAAMVFVLALSMNEPAAAFLVIISVIFAYVGETIGMRTTALVGCLCFMAIALGTLALRWYL